MSFKKQLKIGRWYVESQKSYHYCELDKREYLPYHEPSSIHTYIDIDPYSEQYKDIKVSKNFCVHELLCKCGCGYYKYYEPWVIKRQQVRDSLAQTMSIRSGCRCPKHNINSGSKNIESDHVLGHGDDIVTTSSKYRHDLKKAGYDNNVDRFGNGNTYTHIGMSSSLSPNPACVEWNY